MDDENEKEDQPLNLYTERTTSVIWDARFFDGFVIVRPISPNMVRDIRKIKMSKFLSGFEEYNGNVDMIRQWLAGQELDLLQT